MRIRTSLSQVAIALGAGLAASVAVANPTDATDDDGAVRTDIRLADLNGDGIDDVLLRQADGRWSYHPMGNHRAAAADQGEVDIPGQPDEFFGDLDGDGWDDILQRDSDGNWLYHPMSGRESTTGARGANITRNTDWNVAGLADFNGDGTDDVLLRHDDTGNWYYFPMQGNRHIPAGPAGRGMTDLPKDKDWRLAGLGDLNGDGKADVLLRHSGSGNWYYIPMDGQQTIVEQRGPARLPNSRAWSFAGIGDFDGDGMNEVLLRHGDGRWQRHSIVGRESLAGDPVANLPANTDWQFAGIGDLNGDGRDDVLLAHHDGRWRSSSAISFERLPSARRPHLEATSATPKPVNLVCNKLLGTMPGTAKLYDLADGYGIVNLDDEESAYEQIVSTPGHANVEVYWNKLKGKEGDYVRYLLNDVAVIDETAPWHSGSYQEETRTLAISKAGQYDLQIALCHWLGQLRTFSDSCCSYSNVESFEVSDTDGKHLVGLELNEGTGNTPYLNTTNSVVGAYFVEWSIYGRDYDVDNIPAYNLTHLLYGFIPICGGDTINDSLKSIDDSFEALQTSCEGRDDFKVAIHDPWGALFEPRPQSGLEWGKAYRGNFGQLMALKQAYPDLKILPSIGGWTLSDPFYYMGDAAKRTTFIESVREFLLTWKFFDGVDIDWEFPGGGGANPTLGTPATDGTTYKLLMAELRAMLDQLEVDTGRSFELSTAIAAGTDKIGRVNYKETEAYLDHIFVMAYDFYGAWSTTVLGHQAGLYAPSWDTTNEYNGHGAIQALKAQGVTPSKLVLGVAMYGRGWSGVQQWDGTNHLTGFATGAVDGTWEPGVLDYKDIAAKSPAAGWTYHYDGTAQAPLPVQQDRHRDGKPGTGGDGGHGGNGGNGGNRQLGDVRRRRSDQLRQRELCSGQRRLRALQRLGRPVRLGARWGQRRHPQCHACRPRPRPGQGEPRAGPAGGRQPERRDRRHGDARRFGVLRSRWRHADLQLGENQRSRRDSEQRLDVDRHVHSTDGDRQHGLPFHRDGQRRHNEQHRQPIRDRGAERAADGRRRRGPELRDPLFDTARRFGQRRGRRRHHLRLDAAQRHPGDHHRRRQGEGELPSAGGDGNPDPAVPARGDRHQPGDHNRHGRHHPDGAEHRHLPDERPPTPASTRHGPPRRAPTPTTPASA